MILWQLQLGVDESYSLLVPNKDGKSNIGEATIEVIPIDWHWLSRSWNCRFMKNIVVLVDLSCFCMRCLKYCQKSTGRSIEFFAWINL